MATIGTFSYISDTGLNPTNIVNLSISGTYSANVNDCNLVLISAVAHNYPVTLPIAAQAGAGKKIGVFASFSGTLLVQVSGSDFLNGGSTTSFSVAQSTGKSFVSDGISGWWAI